MRKFLHEKRPAYVDEMAARQFERVSVYPNDQRYKFLGVEKKYVWRMSGVSSDELLDTNGKEVLDLGSGHGTVLQRYADRAIENVGIAFTAHDYSSGANPYVQVGDAHNIAESIGDSTFDVVMSKWTLQHLVDPLACLEAMINRLEIGGVLATDLRIGQFGLVGCCLDYLVENASVSIVSKRYAEISQLTTSDVVLIRQAIEPITLPIDYEPQPMIGSLQVRYKLDDGV